MSYRYRVMAVYILGVAMTIIDGTIVNVALPTLADEFDVDPTDIEFVAIAYLLAFAAVIPAAGWLGDRFGTKRVFATTLTVFVVASTLCGLAPSLGLLIAARILQGLGAGMITPVGSAMLYRAFPIEQRSTATVGVISVVVIAPAVGPVLGGVLVDHTTWRLIFLVNLPVGIVAIVLSILWLRETTHDRPGRLDGVGLALSAIGVSSLVYALSTGPENGWLSAATITAVVAGSAAIVLLVTHQLRTDEPMLRLRLFEDRLFRTINLAGVFVYSGFFGWIFLVPIYMQVLRGLSATASGLAVAPQAVAVFVVANLLGTRLYRSVGPRRLMLVGTTMTAATTAMCAFFHLETPLWVICGAAFARGLSVGMVFVSIQTAVYATITPEDTARATSLFNTQRQISFATGVALAATVLAARIGAVGGETASAAEQLGAYRWAFVVMGLLIVPAGAVSWFIVDDDAAATRRTVPA